MGLASCVVSGEIASLEIVRGGQGKSGSSGASGRSPGLKGAVELLHSPLLKIRCPHRLEIFDSLLGIGQMVDRFPGGIVEWVSFPLNEVLWRFSQDSFIQNGFNLIFFFVIWCDNGWGRRWASKFFGGGLVRLE